MNRTNIATCRLAVLLMLTPPAALAGEARILDVRVECPTGCTFAVTLEHDDQGRNHYADQWDVVTLDGVILKSRVLHHPHENEQPFTRSLSAVAVPQGMRQVRIRARDSVHGYSTQGFLVDLPR